MNSYLFFRKSPPSPLSPGQQKRVRFLVDNNNDQSSMCCFQTDFEKK